MSVSIPKKSAALIISEDSETGFIDLEVIYPEVWVDGDKRVAIVNLAEQLLESALFGQDYGDNQE